MNGDGWKKTVLKMKLDGLPKKIETYVHLDFFIVVRTQSSFNRLEFNVVRGRKKKFSLMEHRRDETLSRAIDKSGIGVT